MKKNMGSVDRVIRIVFAALVGVLYATDQISGTTALVLGLFAAIFLVTALVRFCPLYYPFGLSTTGTSGEKEGA